MFTDNESKDFRCWKYATSTLRQITNLFFFVIVDMPTAKVENEVGTPNTEKAPLIGDGQKFDTIDLSTPTTETPNPALGAGGVFEGGHNGPAIEPVVTVTNGGIPATTEDTTQGEAAPEDTEDTEPPEEQSKDESDEQKEDTGDEKQEETADEQKDEAADEKEEETADENKDSEADDSKAEDKPADSEETPAEEDKTEEKQQATMQPSFELPAPPPPIANDNQTSVDFPEPPPEAEAGGESADIKTDSEQAKPDTSDSDDNIKFIDASDSKDT